MALTISNQFNKFVEFAESQRNPRTSTAVARLTAAAGNLDARNIHAANPRNDSVGRIGRRDDERGANNEARTAFRQTVIDMFGGEEYVPKNVRMAMKLNDYDRGKPLTARRIMAVKVAIETYRQSAEQAFDDASEIARLGMLYAAHGQGGVNHDWNARVDGLIAVAVNASVGDPDALDVVKAMIVGIVKAEGANLRTEEQIKESVSNILANVAELKAAAKGNAHILKAGKDLLKQMGGTRIPDGAIRSMVGSIMKQDIGKLKSLKTATTGINLHKAMMQTLKNVDQAIAASGVEGTFSVDTQAYGRIRKFCIAVQLARCGDAAARRIKGLFSETDKAVMLSRIYHDIGESEYERGGLARDMLNRMEDLGHFFSEGIAHLYALLQERTGVPENERQGLRQVEELNEELVGKNAVKDDLLALAGENADRDKAGFLNVIVSGRGQGADKVRGLYSSVLGERPFKPDVKIRKNVNDNVLGMFNRNFCKTRKVGNIELLKADLESGRIDVVLPGNVRLTRDDAFGRLASFLTHGEAQSYDDLDEIGKKKFVNLVSMLSPDSISLGEKGEALALDGRGRDAKLEFEGNFTKRQFMLSFDNDTLVIRCETERTLDTLRVKDGDAFEAVPARPGSKVETVYEIRIPAAEIDRLAGIRLGKFKNYDDHDIVDGINDNIGNNPHGHTHLRRWLGDLAFNGEVDDYNEDEVQVQVGGVVCTTSFKLTVN